MILVPPVETDTWLAPRPLPNVTDVTPVNPVPTRVTLVPPNLEPDVGESDVRVGAA